MSTANGIKFPPPKLQIEFAFALKRFRAVYLQSALMETIRDMDIAELDKQLAEYVPPTDMATLAQHGLRAELLFAVPTVLKKNPYLLGYYRLLMGYSQKEFYGRDKGFSVGHFKGLEERGKISKTAAADLPDLCTAFCATASALLAGIGPLRVSRELFDDLTLLTVGPQLRGGANNQRGTDGIVQVFEIIREIVAHAVAEVRESAIEVKSATGRPFSIEFAPDPDIIIREEMAHQHYRNVVAIEVKSGTDVSNIHNRIGEAEKSHQKARKRGFTECWTVINVGRLDMAKARIHFQGLPARICWIGLGDRHRAGLMFNEMVRTGELKAPIVIGRDHLDSGSVASPNRETEAMRDGSDAVSDWPLLNALVNTASGATWVSIHHGGGVGMGFSQHSGVVIVADGSDDAAKRLERVLWNDPASGVWRHADAGYDIAIDCAKERGLRLPTILGN